MSGSSRGQSKVRVGVALLVLIGLTARTLAVPQCGPGFHERGTTPCEMLFAYAGSESTSLPAAFDAGRVPVTGIEAAKLGRPYSRVRDAAPNDLLALTMFSPDPPKGPIASWPEPLRTELRYMLDGVDLTRSRRIALHFTHPWGAPDDRHPAITLTHDQAVALHADLHKGIAPRKGGMVYLTGGQLVFRNSPDALADAQLDVCGDRYCLRFANPGLNPVSLSDTVDLPFSPSSRFTATWELTRGNDANALYLSINPLRNMLRDDDPSSIPSTRLLFDPPAAQRANEIVTAGGIDGTELGKIFLDADVAFKSAALGFDVLAGRNAATVQAAEELPDPLVVSPHTVGQSRWCRYAWQSNAQTLEPGTRMVRLSGPAIRAEAEPMQLVDGELTPYPAGGWCGPAKALARRLNTQLQRGKATPAIARLEQVGSIQNLAVFARRNHMATTEAFEQSLRDHPRQQAEPLPKWTSGIRSHTQPVLRLDFRRGPDGEIRRLLAIYADPDDLLAVAPTLAARKARLERVAGTTDGKYDVAIVERELRSALHDLANTLRAQVLPAQEDLLPALHAGFQFWCCFELVPLPTVIHGGVLLRALQPSKDAAELGATLLYPSGTPLFRVDARDALHFWSFGHPAWKNDDVGVGEHLEIHGGRVIARYAVDGKLRFVVQGKQITARHEARLPDNAGDHGIVEWTRSLAIRGVPSAQRQVVWQAPGDTLWLRPASSAADDGDPRLPLDELRLTLSQIDRDLWSVEVAVPFDPIAADLQRRHAAVSGGTDADAIATVIADAVTWGAHDLARDWTEELGAKLLAVDSVDTLYTHALSDSPGLAGLVSALADAEFRWLSVGHNVAGSRSVVVEHLDRLAALLQRLPPPTARDSHAAAATALRTAAAATREPQRRTLLETRSREHERSAKIAAALVP